MTAYRVFIMAAHVLFFCACGASNGGVDISAASMALIDEDRACEVVIPAATSEVLIDLQQVCLLTNRERESRGLVPLILSPELHLVSQAHAIDMAARNFFSHTNPNGENPFDRLARNGIIYNTAAENIAVAQRTPQEVVQAWMSSTGHRNNILNPRLLKLGLGFHGGYWVQVFTN